MAENATISTTKHRTATLESLNEFGAENTPLDLRSLINAIKDNNTDEALKAAEDIFSGSPTNIKRLLEIHHQRTDGIGHTSFVNTYNDASNTNSAEKKQKRHADIAFLNLLNIQRYTAQLINKIIERATKIHEKTTDLIKDELKKTDKIKDLIDDQHDLHDCDPKDRAEIKALLEARDQRLIETQERSVFLLERTKLDTAEVMELVNKLPSEGADIANNIIKMRAMPENAGLDSATLAKQNPEYAQLIKDMAKYCEENGLLEERDQMKAMFDSLAENQKELSKLYKMTLQHEKLTDDLIKGLDKGTLSDQEIISRLKDITTLKADISIQDKYTKSVYTENAAIIETGKATLDELREKLQDIENHEQEAKDYKAAITDTVSEYGNRHEQLATLHGDGITKFVREITILNDFNLFGQTSAWLYAEGNKLIGRDSATVTAWEKAIQHEGKDVYRDNDTTELYTYDEDTGERTYIRDTATFLDLSERAYKGGELFRNETPYSKDPNNTFDDTLESMKQSASDISNGIEQNVIIVIQAQRIKIERQIQEQSPQDAQTASISDKKLAPTFGQNAAPIPRSTSTFGQIFYDAKDALNNIIDKSTQSPLPEHTIAAPLVPNQD